MANYELAYPHLKLNEGGFVLTNNKNDTGKLTYCGISQKWWPKWEGWPHIAAEEYEIVKPMVKVFYKNNFWDTIKADQIENQEMAYSIFDFGVNADFRVSAKLAQTIIGVKADGWIGQESLCALNEIPNDAKDLKIFHLIFALAKIVAYKDIAYNDKTQLANIIGWINRTVNVLELSENIEL